MGSEITRHEVGDKVIFRIDNEVREVIAYIPHLDKYLISGIGRHVSPTELTRENLELKDIERDERR